MLDRPVLTNGSASVPESQKRHSVLLQNFNGLTIAFTFYALFGDDIRLAYASVSADDVFVALSVIALMLFTIELMVNWVADSHYRFRFYFYIDLVAIISLIPEITWIWDPFMNSFRSGDDAVDDTGWGNSSKMLRMVRLVRIVRMGKLFKMTSVSSTAGQLEGVGQPSKVGQTMSDMTLRRVIMLVFILIIALPIFDGGFTQNFNPYQQKGLQRLHHFAQLAQDYNKTGYIDEEVSHHIFDQFVQLAGPLLHIDIDVCDTETNKLCCPLATPGCEGRDSWSAAKTNEWLKELRFQPNDADATTTIVDRSAAYALETNPALNADGWSFMGFYIQDKGTIKSRYRETEYYTVMEEGCYIDTSSAIASSYKGCKTKAYFSIKNEITVPAAKMNMVKTLVVMVVLFLGLRSFQNVSHRLVIDPLMRMTNLIRTLAINPLASTSMKDAIDTKTGYETHLLMNTLTKIGALMQVGFGAAGAEIIGKNLGTAGELDPMVPGKKITAIYGFCDIRKFTDTTECLQEEVMVYVNRLGDLVHDCTHSYYGKANKNVGDAFLLSWKLCDGLLQGYADFDDEPDDVQRAAAEKEVLCPPNEGFGLIKRRLSPVEVADSALTAFLKCLVDIENANTDGVLKRYRSNPRILARFGPDFRIRMGFGLHLGWAIEGAIGSAFKIDATYISPHVEMSDRLEAGSKIFGVPINLSQWFVALLSPPARSFLRILDRVKVSGCSQPMTIYTYDVVNMIRDFGEPKFDEYGQQLPVDFIGDRSYKQLQHGIPQIFFNEYTKGVQHYFTGKWSHAKIHLERARNLKPDDGPIESLYDFMRGHEFNAPEGWSGYRHMAEF